MSGLFTIYQALEESVHSKSNVRDSGFGEGWFSDREDLFSWKQSGYRRDDSVESLDSVESRTLSVASNCTLRAGSEGKTLCLFIGNKNVYANCMICCKTSQQIGFGNPCISKACFEFTRS